LLLRLLLLLGRGRRLRQPLGTICAAPHLRKNGIKGFKPGWVPKASEADDAQKARYACNIGTQPVKPAVYGVNAPV
jgi:hypothetical protein